MAIWTQKFQIVETCILRVTVFVIHFDWNFACSRINFTPTTFGTFCSVPINQKLPICSVASSYLTFFRSYNKLPVYVVTLADVTAKFTIFFEMDELRNSHFLELTTRLERAPSILQVSSNTILLR